MADDVKIASLRHARPAEDVAAEEEKAAFYHRLAIPALTVAIVLGCVALVNADWNGWMTGASSQSTDAAEVFQHRPHFDPLFADREGAQGGLMPAAAFLEDRQGFVHCTAKIGRAHV